MQIEKLVHTPIVYIYNIFLFLVLLNIFLFSYSPAISSGNPTIGYVIIALTALGGLAMVCLGVIKYRFSTLSYKEKVTLNIGLFLGLLSIAYVSVILYIIIRLSDFGF